MWILGAADCLYLPTLFEWFLASRRDADPPREAVRAVVQALIDHEAGRSSCDRKVLGLAGPAEDGVLWLEFLRGLLARGLTDTQLVISGAHQGLRTVSHKHCTGPPGNDVECIA